MKTVLVIDKEEETFEDLMTILNDFTFSKETLVFLNKKSLKIPEINELIEECRPDIILVGHVLRGIFRECGTCKSIHGRDVKFTKCPSCHLDGLQALKRLNSISKETKVISISSFAVDSNELISKYQQIGVSHFSGRDHHRIVSCILEKCDCKKS